MGAKQYEPGAAKRGPDGQVATKTRLDDDGPGGIQSWIVVNPDTALVQHMSTAAVSGWDDLK